MSMREWRASRSSIWSKKPMPVATLATPDPSRFTATSMSVSLVLRLRLAVRMRIGLESSVLRLPEHDLAWKNRGGPALQARAPFLDHALKTRPFIRLAQPSLLQYGQVRAELLLIVTAVIPNHGRL